MSAIRRRWRFTGEVQGVGFRYYARAAAQHLGLTGWVANNWDGSVTLEAQGTRAALDALVPLIERTNRWARIENIETAPSPSRSMSTGLRNGAGIKFTGSAAEWQRCPLFCLHLPAVTAIIILYQYQKGFSFCPELYILSLRLSAIWTICRPAWLPPSAWRTSSPPRTPA